MGEATHPGGGMGVGAARAGTLAAACCGKACEAAEGQHGLITRDASGLILPFGFGSARGNLEGTETTRVEEWEKDGTVALRARPVTMSCDGLGLTAGRRA